MRSLTIALLLLSLVGVACSTEPENQDDDAVYSINGTVGVTEVGGEWRYGVIRLVQADARGQSGDGCSGTRESGLDAGCSEGYWLSIRQAAAEINCPVGIGGRYTGIYATAQVIVSDVAGTVVGVGTLVGGKVAYVPLTGARDVALGTQVEPFFNPACIFQFVVDNLPASEFYSFEIPGQNTVVVPFSDLEADDWAVELLYGFKGVFVLGSVDAPPPPTPSTSTP
ncbi:MAG: hypothetical protein GXP36_12050 [Actinobacteria bacterium]|nr:hypothetical protein [Actinomycetota bacterium]